MKVLRFIKRLIWAIVAIIAIAVVTCASLVWFFGANVDTLNEEEIKNIEQAELEKAE